MNHPRLGKSSRGIINEIIGSLITGITGIIREDKIIIIVEGEDGDFKIFGNFVRFIF